MKKHLGLFFLAVADNTGAFVPHLRMHSALASTRLEMGWLENINFRSIHGHGSGEKELAKIYEDEKELLKDRKKHFSKAAMKTKYNKTVQKGFLEDFFSHPFHAQGSSHKESDLDAMFAAQQQVLYERREYFGNKQMLRKKYSHMKNDHLKDIPVHKHDPKLLNQKEDDAMYIDESFDRHAFKVPFLKNLNKLKP
jgi:hypothetical protein